MKNHFFFLFLVSTSFAQCMEISERENDQTIKDLLLVAKWTEKQYPAQPIDISHHFGGKKNHCDNTCDSSINPQNATSILVNFLEHNNINIPDLPRGKELYTYLRQIESKKRSELITEILESLSQIQLEQLNARFVLSNGTDNTSASHVWGFRVRPPFQDF